MLHVVALLAFLVATTTSCTGANGSAGDTDDGGAQTAVDAGPLRCAPPASFVDDTGDPISCDPVLFGDDDTEAGYEMCGREVFRVSAEACTATDYSVSCEPNHEGCGGSACTADEECRGDDQGYGCRCVVPCVVDDDCGPGRACVCGNASTGTSPNERRGAILDFTRCVPAECRTDADCPAAARCAVSTALCGPTTGLYCQRRAAHCTESDYSDADRCYFDVHACAWTASYLSECD